MAAAEAGDVDEDEMSADEPALGDSDSRTVASAAWSAVLTQDGAGGDDVSDEADTCVGVASARRSVTSLLSVLLDDVTLPGDEDDVVVTSLAR